MQKSNKWTIKIKRKIINNKYIKWWNILNLEKKKWLNTTINTHNDNYNRDLQTLCYIYIYIYYSDKKNVVYRYIHIVYIHCFSNSESNFASITIFSFLAFSEVICQFEDSGKSDFWLLSENWLVRIPNFKVAMRGFSVSGKNER